LSKEEGQVMKKGGQKREVNKGRFAVEELFLLDGTGCAKDLSANSKMLLHQVHAGKGCILKRSL
jgi:hypothetical protein